MHETTCGYPANAWTCMFCNRFYKPSIEPSWPNATQTNLHGSKHPERRDIKKNNFRFEEIDNQLCSFCGRSPSAVRAEIVARKVSHRSCTRCTALHEQRTRGSEGLWHYRTLHCTGHTKIETSINSLDIVALVHWLSNVLRTFGSNFDSVCKFKSDAWSVNADDIGWELQLVGRQSCVARSGAAEISVETQEGRLTKVDEGTISSITVFEISGSALRNIASKQKTLRSLDNCNIVRRQTTSCVAT